MVTELLVALVLAAASDAVCQSATASGGVFTLAVSGLGAERLDVCPDLAGLLELNAPPFTAAQARNAEKLLPETRYVDQVHCAVQRDGAELRCEATPRPIVRQVRLTGEVPFSMLAT